MKSVFLLIGADNWEGFREPHGIYSTLDKAIEGRMKSTDRPDSWHVFELDIDAATCFEVWHKDGNKPAPSARGQAMTPLQWKEDKLGQIAPVALPEHFPKFEALIYMISSTKFRLGLVPKSLGHALHIGDHASLESAKEVAALIDWNAAALLWFTRMKIKPPAAPAYPPGSCQRCGDPDPQCVCYAR